ncbi:MAG: hypothetical protein QOF76_1744, partial [Solirubrobacteraceae bacterium]|nr:hypothetical protein [Solirubrobacteraceae bacterium]
MTAIGLILPGATAFAAAGLLRPTTWAAFGLAAYVLLVAEVVGLVEALSLFTAVDAAHLVVLEGLLAVAVGAVFALQGVRGRLSAPPLGTPRAALARLRARPLLALLLAAVTVALAYELALALFTPPNNDDSLTYHLSRAAAWYQGHRVGYVHSHSQRENGSAPNAEILILLTFVFTHGDRVAAAWQWLAQLATLPAIYLIGLRLGLRRAEALFAALIFATLAQPALQASTTQNDLVAASLVTAAVAFLTTDLSRRYELAGLALALALGTKLTVAFALPGLAIAAAALVPRRDWLRLLATTGAAFALFGAYVYVLNVMHTGAIQGSGAAVAASAQHSWEGRLTTALHVPEQLVVHWSPTNQDLSYFGPLGALALVPVVLAALLRWLRRRASTLEAALALGLPLYVLGVAMSYRYNPYIGRYMLTPVALVAPLVGRIARSLAYATVVVVVGVGTLAVALVGNHAKPAGLGATRSIWTMPRAQAMSIERPPMQAFIEELEACVPPTARLG